MERAAASSAGDFVGFCGADGCAGAVLSWFALE